MLTTLVGGVMGMSGISGEDATKVIAYLETLQATHDMNQELATALAEKLPASSLVPPGVADARSMNGCMTVVQPSNMKCATASMSLRARSTTY